MLININQKDKRLLRVIRDYGCLFLCFAYVSPLKFEGEVGCNQLNSIFLDAINSNIISGDLNKDGDYDDAGEAEVLITTDWQDYSISMLYMTAFTMMQ